MLSRIIEHASAQSHAQDFLPERVSQAPQAAPAPEADAAALNRRIAQLEQALRDAEAAAYARGRREADTDSHQRFSAAMQNTADRLAQSVKELADIRPRLCREAETDLLRLSLTIAQRILHRQLNIDSTALEALVKVSLERLGRQEQIGVRVNPSLADSVRAILARLTSRPIEVTADANLEAGSLIFETNRGQLDASISSQLDEIERGLIDHLSGRPQ